MKPSKRKPKWGDTLPLNIRQGRFNPNRKEIEEATDRYLKEGGTITKLKPVPENPYRYHYGSKSPAPY